MRWLKKQRVNIWTNNFRIHSVWNYIFSFSVLLRRRLQLTHLTVFIDSFFVSARKRSWIAEFNMAGGCGFWVLRVLTCELRERWQRSRASMATWGVCPDSKGINQGTRRGWGKMGAVRKMKETLVGLKKLALQMAKRLRYHIVLAQNIDIQTGRRIAELRWW